jgi:hypothetical protein
MGEGLYFDAVFENEVEAYWLSRMDRIRRLGEKSLLYPKTS